jgi:hypothetical protein
MLSSYRIRGIDGTAHLTCGHPGLKDLDDQIGAVSSIGRPKVLSVEKVALAQRLHAGGESAASSPRHLASAVPRFTGSSPSTETGRYGACRNVPSRRTCSRYGISALGAPVKMRMRIIGKMNTTQYDRLNPVIQTMTRTT